jgi:hypothetical protein
LEVLISVGWGCSARAGAGQGFQAAIQRDKFVNVGNADAFLLDLGVRAANTTFLAMQQPPPPLLLLPSPGVVVAQ